MSYRDAASSYPRGSSSSSGGGSRSANYTSSSSWASPSRSAAGGAGAYSAAYDDSRRYAVAASHQQGYGHSTFPSPATSSTSTASSLRTPPDLLLNGTAMATAWKSGALHSLEKQPPPPAYLSIAEIEKRIKLLSTLPSELMSDALPSPPSSPRPAARKKAARMDEPERERQGSTSRQEERRSNGAAARTSTSSSLKAPSTSTAARKRKSDVARVDYSDDSDVEEKSRSAGADKRRRTTSNASSMRSGREEDAAMKRSSSGESRSREASSSSVRLEPPEPREWSKERFLEVAASYRTHGRELKHRGDQRLREASSAQLSLTQPSQASLLAALEQTDALLLYVYGFWCEDQAATSGSVPHACVAHNWASLFGLLKYVHACHERNGTKALAGLCRLLEAVVLRRLAEHEQRLLSHRLQKLAAQAASSAGSASAAGSPSANIEVTAPSPASAHSADTTAATVPAELISALADAARSMAKSVADSERSNKLFAQARVALSASVLEAHYPEVYAASLASSQMEAWRDASRLDPAAIGLTSKEDSSAARWAWPLEHVTPLPHFVTFGRALLRETAATTRLNFRPARVLPSSSSRS